MPIADLIGMQNETDLLGLNQQLSDLSASRNELLEEALPQPSLGGTLGRLLAVSVPLLLADDKRSRGAAGASAADALGLGIKLDEQDKARGERRRRQKLDALNTDIARTERRKDSAVQFDRQLQRDQAQFDQQLQRDQEGRDFQREMAEFNDVQADLRQLANQKFQREMAAASSEQQARQVEQRRQEFDRQQEVLQKNRVALAEHKQKIKNEVGKSGGEPISEGTTVKLAGSETALDSLKTISNMHEKYVDTSNYGRVGRGLSSLASNIPLVNTSAGLYNDSRRVAAQTVGTFLEGGKLTDADYSEKYINFFAAASDSKEVGQFKHQLLERMIKSKLFNEVDALGGVGFDITPWQAELKKFKVDQLKEKALAQ